MKIKWVVGLALLISLFTFGFLFACDNSFDDGERSDDDTADDDAADDDVVIDDDSVTDDDSVADDDAADDDTAAAPTFPNNHASSWDCYLCHETAFLHAKAEPHGHVYNAPDDCLGCHAEGNWTNPSYAVGHNAGQNCIGCHNNHHGKTWQDKNQCLVCHATTGAGDDDDEDDDK